MKIASTIKQSNAKSNKRTNLDHLTVVQLQPLIFTEPSLTVCNKPNACEVKENIQFNDMHAIIFEPFVQICIVYVKFLNNYRYLPIDTH